MKRTIMLSLSLACGACTGWAFALAVDLARTPPPELSAPAVPAPGARAALPVADAAHLETEAGAPKDAAGADPETGEGAEEEGCD